MKLLIGKSRGAYSIFKLDINHENNTIHSDVNNWHCNVSKQNDRGKDENQQSKLSKALKL